MDQSSQHSEEKSATGVTAKPVDSSVSGSQSVRHAERRLAEDNAAQEHKMTPLQAIKVYPMAVFWCCVISTCVIMEGYDQILVQSFFAYPAFQRKYGDFVGTGTSGYQLSAAWQAGLSNAGSVGAFIGTLCNGYLVNRFGHKHVVLGALLVLSAFIFLSFFASNVTVLLLSQIFEGLPWGVFSTAAPAYASECLPMALRVYLTSYTNMCFIIGQFVAAGVLRGLESRTDEWAYRIPFALQWMWPVILIPLVAMAPTSPWHEVRKGRMEEAEKSLRRLQNSKAGVNPKAALAEIVYTNELEEKLSVGTSYWDCFKGVQRRRTEIACVAFMAQILAGTPFAYNSSYFFEQIGLSTAETYSLSLGGTGLALFGTILAWLLVMPYFGRRTIYLAGLSVMVLTLLTIGILNPWTSRASIGWAQAVLCLFWTLVFQLSVGQLGWATPAELPATRLRQKTICLARALYYVAQAISNVLEPYMINPTAWNWTGYTGFFWGGLAGLTLVYMFFRLPETRDRNNEELDVLFAKGVAARDFSRTDVSMYDLEQLSSGEV